MLYVKYQKWDWYFAIQFIKTDAYLREWDKNNE